MTKHIIIMDFEHINMIYKKRQYRIVSKIQIMQNGTKMQVVLLDLWIWRQLREDLISSPYRIANIVSKKQLIQ